MRGFHQPAGPIIYLFFLFAGGTLIAQDQQLLDPVSDTYAIINATIIPAPGRIIEKGVVIIKGGLIQALGKDLAIPPQAIIMNADSMFAYAGFIEGLSYTGVIKPRDDNHERPKDPGDPLPATAGITPETDVRNRLDPDDRSVREMRCAGFGTSQVVPHGNFLPGSGAVVLLGGLTADEMVLEPKSSFYAELSWNKVIYPSTIMGLLAKWRELYRQAALDKDYQLVYASGASGLPRPSSDRILESFYPVMEKQMPVLFKAEKVMDIQRVLSLQKELGFILTLADVKEGWDVVDKIKGSAAGVFLSLDLPEEIKDFNKANAKMADGRKDSAAINPELAGLQSRRADFIHKMVSQAAVFDKAGVKFGFSAMDVKAGDVHKNLLRMVDAGLSEETALAALTIQAAELLGVDDRLGTLDKGKIANLVVYDKPLFNKDARVNMVFVDGVLYQCEEKILKKNGAKEVLEGAWTFTTQTPRGVSDLKVVFNRNPDDQFGGSISGGDLPEAINMTSVTLKGKSLRFVYTVTFEGNKYEVTVDGSLEGRTFSGNMNVGEFGPFPMNGAKDPRY
jgi:Amidohydrolase family